MDNLGIQPPTHQQAAGQPQPSAAPQSGFQPYQPAQSVPGRVQDTSVATPQAIADASKQALNNVPGEQATRVVDGQGIVTQNNGL